ncbi:Yop1p [Rhizophagus irregularis DAOM 197198w]|uniref:Protein YOP1 n=1 Tax=Rhizophagus irregularis (strain DAOM 197198w) TaxID=1432141 RepID=A0A015J1B3_RHIIW|nr:Yop1p [Rhizophagus irregularis DAOM 197198w]
MFGDNYCQILSAGFILVLCCEKLYMNTAAMSFVGKVLNNIFFLAYTSFKAIESTEKSDDTQWLTYWTVFGFLNIIEFFSDTILYWIPFYYLFKTVFFLWLFLPPFKGAQVLYAKFLRPFLIAYQGDVDSSLNKLKSKVNEATKEAMNSVVDSVSSDRSDKTE